MNNGDKIRLIHNFESILEQKFEHGRLLEAAVVQNLVQRNAIWERREATAGVIVSQKPMINDDVTPRLNKVSEFLSVI